MFKLSSDHLANFRSIGALLETIKGWIEDIRRRVGLTEDRIEALESISGSIGVTLPIDAVDVDYDNGTSGLAATDVQAAIDELAGSTGATNIPYQFDDARTWRGPQGRLSADALTLTNLSSTDTYSTALSYPCRHEDSKVYFEVNVTGTGGSGDFVGIITNNAAEYMGALASDPGSADPYYHIGYNGNAIYRQRTTTASASAGFGSSWGANAIIGIAVDRVGGKVYLRINGTWQGSVDPDDDDSTHQSNNWKHRFRAYCAAYNTGISMKLVAREVDMTYSVPTGYVALAG